MAVNYLTGHNATFEQAEGYEKPAQAKNETLVNRRIFIDEEHREGERFPFKQAEKAPWVSLFLNQLRIYF